MRKLSVALVAMLFLTANTTHCGAAPIVRGLSKRIIQQDKTDGQALNSKEGRDVASEKNLKLNLRPERSSDETGIHPVRIIPTVRGEAWKSSDRFEISSVEGLQSSCNVEEQITFTVEGTSDKFLVEEGTGFNVTATIFDQSRKSGHRAAYVKTNFTIEYDQAKRLWQVKFAAPKVSNDKYAVAVHLFCEKKDSPCSETYGYGTQISKVFPLKVH